MNFQMSGRKPDSVMWEHFSKPVDENGVEDFRKAKCHHCPAVLSRGKPDTPFNLCSNGSMWSHMRNKHKAELEEAKKEMETTTGAPCLAKSWTSCSSSDEGGQTKI